MQLHFSTKPADLVTCELVVVGINEEERPPQNAAGLIDWRMHGFISKQIQENNFTAAKGEFLLVPGDQRLKCNWVLIAGLGSALDMNAEIIHTFCYDALIKAKQLAAKSCMVIYPNIITTVPYYREALKWLLEGIGKAATDDLDCKYFEEVDLYIPSKSDETVDLAKVMLPKLLARHGLTFTPTAI